MRVWKASSAALVIAIAVLNGLPIGAQQPPAQPPTVQTDNKSIGGVVTSRFGPEAGVWVIAETRDLGTRFAKMVATDERGRYVIPDLPKANYRVWVRGYGLVDSEKVASEPGKTVNLTAAVAPSLAAAAQYYPAIYWAAMIKIPDKSRFPGTGDTGNGIPEMFKTQDQWLNFIKTNGCGNCHQMGNYATRTIPRGARQIRLVARRVDAAPRRRAGRSRHGALHHPAGDPGRRPPRGARRLDRPHQVRRIAEPQPGAAGRDRAQPRRHRARLVRPQALFARFDGHRPAQADGQPLWLDVWCARAQHRRSAGPRSRP